jgi:4-amino-4-deoxy-L-arabinose transferase-like glycosyltransferase
MLPMMTMKPATSAQHRSLTLALTLLLTLAGFSLRFYRLSNQSLWTDEISSITTARVPLSQITQQSGEVNNCLPTYFLLLRAVLGDSNQDIEFRARWLSALMGALSVPLLIGVVYLWRQQWAAALLAGLLLAVNPLHLWYSQEARAYATMLFFGLLALLAYELARRSRKSWWWLVYFVSALGAVALHKTGLIFPVACALWHGWEVLRGRRRIRELAVPVATLAIALGALLLKSYPPPPEYGRRSSILEIGYTFITFVGGYSFGPSLADIQSHGAWGAVSRNLVQVGILGGVLTLVAVAYVLHLGSLIRGKETTLLVLNVGFVAVAALISAFPYNIRYTLPALLAFVALVAALATCARRLVVARLSVLGVLLVGLWSDAQWFYSSSYRKGDSRAVAQWLVDNQAHVKTWTVLPDYLSRSVEWYLQGHPEILSARQAPTGPQTTSFPPVPDVLIIGRRHHILEPDKLIAAYQARARGVRAIFSVAGFELYVQNAAQAAALLPSARVAPR